MISLQFLYRNARSQEKGIVCRRITCFNWRSPKPSNAWEGETALDENFINFSSNKPQGELQNKSRGELQRKLKWKGNNACKYPALPTLLKVKCNVCVLRLENKKTFTKWLHTTSSLFMHSRHKIFWNKNPKAEHHLLVKPEENQKTRLDGLRLIVNALYTFSSVHFWASPADSLHLPFIFTFTLYDMAVPTRQLEVNSAQRVPEPDPLPGISFDTRPDPIQF